MCMSSFKSLNIHWERSLVTFCLRLKAEDNCYAGPATNLTILVNQSQKKNTHYGGKGSLKYHIRKLITALIFDS